MQYRAFALSPPFAGQRLLEGTFGTNLVSYLKSCPGEDLRSQSRPVHHALNGHTYKVGACSDVQSQSAQRCQIPCLSYAQKPVSLSSPCSE
jgi:hypothetical protein